MVDSKPTQKDMTKKKNTREIIVASLMVLLGVGLAMGLAYGGLWLYEYLKKPAMPAVENPAQPTSLMQPYQPSMPSGILAKTVYKNEEDGYLIRPPKDWEIDTSGKLGAKVYFIGSGSAESQFVYNPNIYVLTGLAKGYLLDGYRQLYFKDLKSKLVDFKVLEEKTLTFSGREVYLATISFKQSDLSLTGEVLMMVSIDTVYIVTGLDLESNWSTTKEVIETSLYTFNLL